MVRVIRSTRPASRSLRVMMGSLLGPVGGSTVRTFRFRCRAAPDFRLEDGVLARDGGALDGTAGELLDAAEQVVLVGRGEARCAAGSLRARSAADAVHVILGHVRQIE